MEISKNYYLPFILLCLGVTANAQTTPTKIKTAKRSKIDTTKVHQLDDVYFHQTGNPNKAHFLSGKAGIPTMENPQSTTIVAHEIIEMQQAQQLSDVMRNVNGVYVASSRGSAQDSYGARGYLFDSGNNILKNGARMNGATFPEVSGLERVEVLKGSAAILYGNVAPGGVVNLITKKPLFEKGGLFAANYGSWNNFKATGDMFGPLSNHVALRVNGAFETKNSFRDVVKSNKYYVNPSVLFEISKKTHLIIEADYLDLNFTPDFGVGSLIDAKTQISKLNTQVDRNAYFGPNWQYSHTKQASSDFILNHDFNKNWKLNVVGSYQNYQRDYYATERVQFYYNNDGAIPENSARVQISKSFTTQNYTSAMANLNGKFKTGSIGHQMLTGFDIDYTLTKTRFDGTNVNGKLVKLSAYNGSNYLFELNNPNSWRNIPKYEQTQAFDLTTTPQFRFGAYAQDLLAYKKFRFLAGLRYSVINNLSSNTYTYNTDTKKDNPFLRQAAFSPRLGLVYLPNEQVSAFASYANSFIPNSGIDINNQPLKPSIVDQYELGVKTNYLKNKLGINFTLYQIDNSNLSQPDPNNVNFRILAGKTRSRGAELDIVGNPIENLQLIAGGAYTHMVYVSTPNAKGSFIVGEQLVRIPNYTGNLAAFYTFNQWAKGLRLGLMANYLGKRTAGWNNTKEQTQVDRRIHVPGFTTVDFTVGYQYKKLNLQGKLANIGNTLNYNVHENYSVNPIAPRNFYLTLSYKL